MRARLVVAAPILSLMVSCSSESHAPPPTFDEDTGADASRGDAETGADTGHDTGADAPRPDTAAETSPEAGPDTAPDTAPGEVAADSGGAFDDAFGADTADADAAADADADVPDASPAIVPVGAPCAASSTCDPTGAHVGLCSSDLYPPDPTDPDPFCVARACTLGPSGTAARCGVGGMGVCVPGGSANECFPACTFPTSGATPPSGCTGKDACNYYGTQTDAAGTLEGVGFCSGGCTADADCKLGVCQVEDGVCVATRKTYAKTLGDACTGVDGECPCVLNSATLSGFCTRFCLTGSAVATCSAGFTCDPGLLAATFSAVPPGLVGSCFKNCTTDADCTAFGAYCATGSATGVSVCRAGPKP